MADNNMMSLSIDKSMLTPVIEQQVKLLMTEVMGGKDAIIDKIINGVLKTKVDEQGKPTTYSSGKPFFEWLLIDEIKKVVVEILHEEIEDRHSTIKQLVRNHIQSDKGSQQIADALIGALASTVDSDYHWKSRVEVKFEKEVNSINN